MAASSSHEAASSTGGPAGENDGSMKTDELGAQISDLKKKQQDLLREKKKLQSELRNTQKKKQRLTKRTRMLSDKDLLDIMRMRAAVAPKENRVADAGTARTSQAESPGAAASLATRWEADKQQAAASSEGKSEELPDSPAE